MGQTSLSYSLSGIGVERGFSCEVNLFISSVADTSLVRQIKMVETTIAAVHAIPPSMPKLPPVNHAGPRSVPWSNGCWTRAFPLTGRPKNDPSAQFQAQ